jgi:hypothetical protein
MIYIDILAVIEIIRLGAEAVNAVQDILDALQEIEDLVTVVVEPTYADMPLELKTELLKRVTRIVANLGLTINCYPLGYSTTLSFDKDGSPIP